VALSDLQNELNFFINYFSLLYRFLVGLSDLQSS
jgi:hypothetical protein